MKIIIEGIEVEVSELRIVLVNKNVKHIYEQIDSLAESIITKNEYAQPLSRGPIEMQESGNIRCPLAFCDPSVPC